MSNQTKLLSATPATTTIGTGEYLAKVDANGQVTRISLADLREALIGDVIVSYKGRLQEDFDTASSVGIYIVSSYPYPMLNAPTGLYGYGALEVINEGDILVQQYTTHRLGVACRHRYQNKWSKWYIIHPDVAI